MIPCVSFTELFPDHHAPTSHYQTMIAGKHRIEHSKLTIFHITPPLPYSLLLPTPFPLHHFPFHFYSASLPSPRHSLVLFPLRITPFTFTPPLPRFSTTSFFHSAPFPILSLTSSPIPSLLFYSASSLSTTAPFSAFPCRCVTASSSSPRIQAPTNRFIIPLLPQRHRFPHFPAVAEQESRGNTVHRACSRGFAEKSIPQRHRFPYFPAVVEAEEAKRGQMRTKYLLKIWFIK